MSKYHFHLCDGSVIKNMKELAFKLETMSDNHFNFHVNERKNDFASWINHTFGEEDLAKRLYAIRDKNVHQLEILKHLVNRNIYL